MFTVLIVFFAAAAAFLWNHSGIDGIFSTVPFYNPSTFSWGTIRTGTSIAVLTYMRFDSISTLFENVKNPECSIILATVSLCLLTGILGDLEVYAEQLI